MNLAQLAKTSLDKQICCLLENVIKAGQEIFLLLQNLDRENELQGGENKFGEKQLKIDIISDKIIQKHLYRSPLVKSFSSEEFPWVKETDHKSATFLVGYDPLDGSSLIGNNLSVGSIFGIWQGDSILGQRGKDLKAAFYFIYGINLNCVIALADSGVYNLEIKNLDFVLRKIGLLNKKSDKFSIGNFKAAQYDNKIMRLLLAYIKKQKTLRYTGCMVADIHKIITDKEGIFIYSGVQELKNKLRLVYECAPMSFIVEKLGGKSMNRKNQPINDLEITKLEATTSIILGSKQAVNLALEYL